VNPVVPVSWGELLDKVTILEIKSERLNDESARAKVGRELDRLSAIADEAMRVQPDVAGLKAVLKRVNETLWRIEDEIRACEAAKRFDAEFVRLARAVYQNNDERGRLKSEINRLLKSEIDEEKQYTKY
jgi:uncharacterized protein DUF6165